MKRSVVFSATVLSLFIGSAGPEALAQKSKPLNFIMITHGVASDSFWAPVKKGAEDAAHDIGATLSYQAPQVTDMVAQANLIRSAINQNPDGLIVTVPDEQALAGPIHDAVAAGIPVIAINSGQDTGSKTGAITFIGEDYSRLGELAGERLKAIGGKSGACLNVQPGNTVLEAICAGFSKAFKGPVKEVPFGFDPAEIAAKTRALLQSNPDIDSILSMSTTNAPVIAGVVDEMGLTGKVHQGTANLSVDVLNSIKNGKMDFALDQQPYLQGYLPVILLALKARYGIEVTTSYIGSGPLLVDKSNAASVLAHVQAGYR